MASVGCDCPLIRRTSHCSPTAAFRHTTLAIVSLSKKTQRNKGCPVHAMTTCMGSITPLILNLITGWRWAANFSPQPLSPKKRTPVGPRTGLKFWMTEKSLASNGIQTPDRPAPVAQSLCRLSSIGSNHIHLQSLTQWRLKAKSPFQLNPKNTYIRWTCLRLTLFSLAQGGIYIGQTGSTSIIVGTNAQFNAVALYAAIFSNVTPTLKGRLTV